MVKLYRRVLSVVGVARRPQLWAYHLVVDVAFRGHNRVAPFLDNGITGEWLLPLQETSLDGIIHNRSNTSRAEKRQYQLVASGELE